MVSAIACSESLSLGGDDDGCAGSAMILAPIFSVVILVCIYAAMYTYWRYTSGLVLATLAVICLWATFTSSLWAQIE